MVHKFEQGSPSDQPINSTPPGVMDEVMRHQMTGRTDNVNLVAYNGDAGLTIHDGPTPMTPEQFGQTFGANYRNLPADGIGSQAQVADAIDWHVSRCHPGIQADVKAHHARIMQHVTQV